MTPQRGFVLERNRRLSESLLWRLQRSFFDQRGVQAWTEAVVPHYITSNPWIADAYAKVVFGWLRDCCAAPGAGALPLAADQPLHIVELGCGSGRFAYLFLVRFLDLVSRSPLAGVRLRYVLTDFTEYNLDVLRNHLALRPFVTAGLLDFARYDAGVDLELRLSESGEVLTPSTLANPLAVIANYVFDGIPQDCFTCRGAGHLYEALVTLTSTQRERDLEDPGILERVRLGWKRRPVRGDYYGEADLDRILDEYAAGLAETTVLFPVGALRCLRNLARLSGGRLLLLSGDKGYSGEAALRGRREPELALHGSFSVMVNFHALGRWLVHAGGELLTTSFESPYLNVSAGLLGSTPGGWMETRLAFDDTVERRGPNDFFAVKQGISAACGAFGLESLLGWLRMSGWDHSIFLGCFPALVEGAIDAEAELQARVAEAAHRVWEAYFPLRETQDLAFHLGALLLVLERPAEAREYFAQSLRLHGENPATCFNLASCHHLLGERGEALEWLDRALAIDPELAAALELRAELIAGHGA
jgi:tetratricopeptide (TPR) repeat protein